MRTIEEQFDRKWLTKEDRPRFAEVPDRRVAEYWYHAGVAAKQEQVLAIATGLPRLQIEGCWHIDLDELERRIKEQE